MQKILVRTDKNGTQYFHCTDRCFKCGGTGIIKCYIPINGGECFNCGGSGISEWDEKEYTPEYEAKLQAQREKREAKKLEQRKAQAAEKNAEFFERNGFTTDGKTYFVLGNTYDIKEELKAQGAKWDTASRHWHMATKPEGREVLEISVEEMYYTDDAGHYDWRNQKIVDSSNAQEVELHYSHKIEMAESKLRAAKSTSEYIGEIGSKIELKVTYIHTSSWENAYSVTNLHTFKDENGNTLVWKTGNFIEADYGTQLTIKGTIKDHSEYKGTKQTVLTRCKIEEV